MVLFYVALVLFLLLLNAFFALAEFAAVKMRASRVDELVAQGNYRAGALKHIKSKVDEYLSVCQVGVTLASVGLGFVGEPAVARLMRPLFERLGPGAESAAMTLSVAAAYLLMSYVSIVFAELVPKTLALRATERAALAIAIPLRFFHGLFYLPLAVLHRSADLITRALGFPANDKADSLTEEELRLVLAESQNHGEISLRQLLHMENVLDAGHMKVRDAMKPRDQVRYLDPDSSWERNLDVIVESRHSRYPLVTSPAEAPTGIVHVKDILYAGKDRLPALPLAGLARPVVTTREDVALQDLLAQLQKRRTLAAVVLDPRGRWTGFITMEDIIEELIGSVGDEFEIDPPLFLADALSPRRVVLDLSAGSMEEAIRKAVESVPGADLPLPAPGIIRAVVEREKRMSTYLGRGVAIPHARLEGLKTPVVIFARSPDGVPVSNREDRARLIFILLTPAAAAHVQVRLLSRIAGILEAGSVERKLQSAKDAGSIIEAIRSGELAALA